MEMLANDYSRSPDLVRQVRLELQNRRSCGKLFMYHREMAWLLLEQLGFDQNWGHVSFFCGSLLLRRAPSSAQQKTPFHLRCWNRRFHQRVFGVPLSCVYVSNIAQLSSKILFTSCTFNPCSHLLYFQVDQISPRSLREYSSILFRIYSFATVAWILLSQYGSNDDSPAIGTL
jgi:hypothetical protein